jgi:hypothetical protein
MSYTELFLVPERGEVYCVAEFKNAFRGAMMVWGQMGSYYLALGSLELMLQDNMQRVWNLWKNDCVPLSDRIVMGATFDRVMVRRENIPRLVNAIRDYATRFDPGHLLDQVEKLLELANDSECFAVCWNQTSVNADAWYVQTDELDKYDDHIYRMYDVSRDTGHWFLFSDFQT